MDKTAQAVERLQEENFRLKGQVGQLVDDMCRKEAERYAGSGSVLIFMDGMDADSVRKLADAVTQTCQGCCAVFPEMQTEATSMQWAKKTAISVSLQKR